MVRKLRAPKILPPAARSPAALRRVRPESVPRFGALDRKFRRRAAVRQFSAKIFLGPRTAARRRPQVVAQRLQLCAPPCEAARWRSARMSKTLVPRALSRAEEIRAYIVRARERERVLRTANADTIRAAATAAARAVHDSLSGVAVFFIVL